MRSWSNTGGTADASRASALALYLATAGCASTAELRKDTPLLTAASKQPARTVAACVADQLERRGLAGGTTPLSFRPTPNGFTLSVGSSLAPLLYMLVDVDEQPDGSSVMRYYRPSAQPWHAMDEAVRQCVT